MYKNPLECKQNIFLTGAGGTGKTYAINDYIKNHPNTLLCASTGTAAVNIGGTTVHRLFSVPVPAYGADPNKITPSQLKVFSDIDTVIIDEISMLRNDVFSFAMRVLKKVETLYSKKIRVIVSGDFSQLPPIVKSAEEKYFTKYGFDKSGFCFTTKEWKELKFKVINLTEVKRQADKEFIGKLSKARIGESGIVSYFNKFVTDDLPEDAIYLCGTNAEADRINQEYLESINAPMTAYQAVKNGVTGKELPCDDIILLKPGCKVMFTANDTIWNADGELNHSFGDKNGTGRYTNGLFGIVKELKSDSVVVETENGNEINVEKHKWSIFKYTVDKVTAVLKKEEIGYVTQIPLKVAKAITIHKSQGKTFSKMILSPQIFAAGQLYVALSRVKGPEGLFISEPVTTEYLKIDKTVSKFYQNNFTWEISESQIKKQKEIEKKQAVKKKIKRKTTAQKTGTAKSKTGTVKKTATSKGKTTSTKKKTTSVKKKPSTATKKLLQQKRRLPQQKERLLQLNALPVQRV